jgi:hypothetical protein
VRKVVEWINAERAGWGCNDIGEPPMPDWQVDIYDGDTIVRRLGVGWSYLSNQDRTHITKRVSRAKAKEVLKLVGITISSEGIRVE